jgi:hypothetical protein
MRCITVARQKLRRVQLDCYINRSINFLKIMNCIRGARLILMTFIGLFNYSLNASLFRLLLILMSAHYFM